jgi:acyl carrier protein
MLAGSMLVTEAGRSVTAADGETPANVDSPPLAPTAQGKIAKVVQRLLTEHSIERTFYIEDNLRDVGLTSLDMASLVLSVEAEFDIMIPERHITPANFRSITAITGLVTELLATAKKTAVPA